MSMAVGVDSTVRQHEWAVLAPEGEVSDRSQEELSGLLMVRDFAGGQEKVPSDLQRVFYDKRQWF